MTRDDFFDETREQSLVKARIVSKYFYAWAKVILTTVQRGVGRIAYMDLYAGKGCYRDGTKSTPLLILESAIRDPALSRSLVVTLTDKKAEYVKCLEDNVRSLPGVGNLSYPPTVARYEVSDDIVAVLQRSRLVPTLLFLDPWGYKGLSLALVNAAIKDWACECIFFFNYNRINLGLANQTVQAHMDAIFGANRAESLRARLPSLSPHQREHAVLGGIVEELRQSNSRFVLPFRFMAADGSRTSHHLIFVSKNFKGYHIMKEVMAGESSSSAQGVPSYEYNPVAALQPMLSGVERPIDNLAAGLLSKYSGRTLSVEQVYEDDSVGSPLVLSCYKQVLLALEGAGRISCDPPLASRRRGTLATGVRVTFP